MLRKPFLREIKKQERERDRLRAGLNKDLQAARKKGATMEDIRNIEGAWHAEIDIVAEEIEYLLTRGAYVLTSEYDLETPSLADNPEMWEERRYGYGHTLTAKGRAFVRDIIRGEQKKQRETVLFWFRDIFAPWAGWILAGLAIALRK